MGFILILSKENIPLAVGEAVSVFKLKKYVLLGNVLCFDSARNPERLAFSNMLCKVLFSCSSKSVVDKAKSYGWSKVYKKSFSVRIKNIAGATTIISEKALAAVIWKKLKNPVVNLRSPKTPIILIVTPKIAFCCIVAREIKHDFSSRKPKLRPGFSPVSLDPKLARGMVNLLGAGNGIILDPFCGTGGLLLEAGLMGFKVVGYDIDEGMLEKAEKNFRFYGVEHFSLAVQDSTKMRVPYDYIVSDLPYGRNSKITSSLNKLYSDFLMNLRKALKKRAVLAFPDFVKYELLLKKAGFRIISQYSHYIHKSLSKRIVIIESIK